jgi:hypothetical protein
MSKLDALGLTWKDDTLLIAGKNLKLSEEEPRKWQVRGENLGLELHMRDKGYALG